MGTGNINVVVKTHRRMNVKCPHCPGGFGQFEIITTNFGGMEGMAQDPIKCGECNNYFKVFTQLKFVGAPLGTKQTPGGIIA